MRCTTCVRQLLITLSDSAEPEVNDLDLSSGDINQYIIELDIPVHYIPPMDILHRRRHLCKHRPDDLGLPLAPLLEVLSQGPARHIFQDQVDLGGVLERGVELENVRVVAALQDGDLLLEGVAAELAPVQPLLVVGLYRNEQARR